METGYFSLATGLPATVLMFYLFLNYRYSFFMTVFGYPLLAASFALLVMVALSPRSVLHEMRVPGAASLAAWSYAIYLTHKQLAILATGELSKLGIGAASAAGVAIMIGISLLGGWLLYRLVETPFMRLRERYYRTIFAVAAAVARHALRRKVDGKQLSGRRPPPGASTHTQSHPPEILAQPIPSTYHGTMAHHHRCSRHPAHNISHLEEQVMLPNTLHRMHPGAHGLVRDLVCALGLCLAISIAHADEFSNFIGMQFAGIPGSNLQMGKTETTLGQFKRFLSARGSDQFETFNRYGDDAPVVYVSWDDAVQFTVWLNRSKPAGDPGTYRLPSEAEWGAACRAGGSHTYCGGDQPDAVAWFDQNSGYRPHAVAGKQPNAFGLHDMSGNVSEWTASCWQDDASARTTSSNCTGRVVRGGSWLSYDGIALGAERYFEAPSSRSQVVGFRVVRTMQ